MTQLQVMICTFGADGIRRVAETAHPRVDGVEYLVSWQTAGMHSPVVPLSLRERPDFTVIATPTRGLSINRNNALSHATAPLLLVSDDDVVYTADRLKRVIAAFDRNPTDGFICFMFESAVAGKSYPAKEFSFDQAIPRGYYTSSIEIALRSEALSKSGVRFDERFGLGARFGSGEEEILIADLLRAGIKGRFVPETIARHDDMTTGPRRADTDEAVRTKGAVFRRIHPYTWPLRMIAHALRLKNGNRLRYLYQWLSGAKLK